MTLRDKWYLFWRAMSSLSYKTVSRDHTFQIKGLSKFCVDNMGQTTLYIGREREETLEIPPESSRAFETPLGDILENEEVWSIRFVSETGKANRANLITWQGRSNDLTERIQ